MRALSVIGIILAPLTAAYTLEQYSILTPELLRASAILLSIIILWVSEVIPLPATALLIPVLISMTGISTPAEAFLPFSNPIIFLFLGAFILAIAMQKHALDKRLAYWIISLPFARSSLFNLTICLGFFSFTLSMWVSNTATCAMLMPIVIGIRAVLKDQIEDEAFINRATILLLLVVAYSTSIGGIATPIGTPPNVITLGLLQNQGLNISFFEWMSFALPLSLTMFIASMFILKLLFPIKMPENFDAQALATHFSIKARELGTIKAEEILVVCTFIIAVTLWLTPDLLLLISPTNTLGLWLQTHLPAAVVAIFVSIILFCLPAPSEKDNRLLKWEDAKTIDWGTLILFGGGLSLGAMLAKVGLAEILGNVLFAWAAQEPLLLIAVSAMLALIITEFASNTATAAVLIPLLIGMTQSELTSISTAAVVVAACLASSYGFMLPVGTPPNAIVFGTGLVPLKSMLRAGIWLNLLGLVLIIVFTGFIL